MRDVNQREPMFTRTINSQFKLPVAQRAVNFTPILPCNPAFVLYVDTLFNPVENVSWFAQSERFNDFMLPNLSLCRNCEKSAVTEVKDFTLH